MKIDKQLNKFTSAALSRGWQVCVEGSGVWVAIRMVRGVWTQMTPFSAFRILKVEGWCSMLAANAAKCQVSSYRDQKHGEENEAVV
jgi:hypothetical protein